MASLSSSLASLPVVSLPREDTESPHQGQEQKFVYFLYFKNRGVFLSMVVCAFNLNRGRGESL